MHPLAARVRRAVRRHDLWPPGAPVAVALSGGSDSVALFHLLRDLQAQGDVRLAGAIHVNHQLRGDASEADEHFCRELAATCGIPLEVTRIDVAAAHRAAGGSLEALARRLRYVALARGAAALAAVRVAVGHTRDDQAETVLLKLLRGAGATGLGGIYPRRDAVVRPLLEIGREELRAWLKAGGNAWREDATNLEPAMTRNRIRHDLLPYIEREFSPHVREQLARTAETLREDAALLDDLAAQVVEGLEGGSGGARLDRNRLDGLPTALARRVVRDALRAVSGGRWVGLAEIEAVLDIARGDRISADLPGVRVELSGAAVVLLLEPLTAKVAVPFSYALEVPGRVWVAEAGCWVEADRRAGFVPGGEAAATASVAGIEGVLTVRNWRAGDRLVPLGLGGHKKLHDLFIDRKVPRADRSRIPVVVDARDHIVWVAGHAISDEFRVTDPGKPVVVLRLTQQSGGRF